MPTRIDGELFEAAKAAGQVQSRSAAQQIDHWARIGREFEAAPAVTHGQIERVLTGQMPYDAVDDPAQAVVRAVWDERIAERIAGLNYAEQFEAAGIQWAEADQDGNAIMRGPGSESS